MKFKRFFVLQVCGVIACLFYVIKTQSWLLTKKKSSTEFIFHGEEQGQICPSGFKEKTEDLLCKKPIMFDRQYKNPCWFEDINELRCLPYFMVIGVQKCGTSDIHDALMKHPEIITPVTINKKFKTNKEFHFFDLYHYADPKSSKYASFDEYVNYFKPVAQRLKDEKTTQFITGEGTPDYFYYFRKWNQIPQNYNRSEPAFLLPNLIKKILPNVKLIISLRKPEYRTLSAFFHVATQRKSFHMKSALSEFRRNITEGLKVLRFCLKTHGEDYCKVSHEMILKYPQIYPGMYHVFLKEWLNVFPRNQFHIINFENYRNNKAETLNGVFKFLKIRQLNTTEMNQREMLLKRIRNNGVTVNKTAVKENLDELREFFKPHNANLKSLLQDYDSKILDWY